ncbi:putative serine carboxypeptidase K10B2.2 [Symbiodinium microadriaticum]|uniref:Putative serine carboxypeptidase K10B2.2 n=1 Tax=Symbiodinium microadriaticum TaxID=2951 RepID=A0A1Q9EIB8_SYMMI|nr:putative serine carboxypeptidase K10B2.2 [Symbiodinium microadriaticum]
MRETGAKPSQMAWCVILQKYAFKGMSAARVVQRDIMAGGDLPPSQDEVGPGFGPHAFGTAASLQVSMNAGLRSDQRLGFKGSLLALPVRNGGPGSSSILGMLQENGPLLINATGGLMRNPYAWTKQANLLILESCPGGVGYSYCAAMKAGGNCNNTDISTARANRAAVQDFFKKRHSSRFPELKANEFFITGVAVGDPCTDLPSQKESMDMLWYAHKHGFVPDSDFDYLWNNCSARRWEAEITPSLALASDEKCKLLNRQFLATTSRGLSQGWKKAAYINELNLFSDASALDWSLPGTLNYYTAQWMMRADVKAALHVESSPATSWPGYNACNDAPGKPSMIDFYRMIAPKLRTTIVFNGDTDPCVSYEGTRTAIEKVGYAVVSGGHYRPWFYDKTSADIEILKEPLGGKPLFTDGRGRESFSGFLFFVRKPNLFGPNLELQPAGPQFGGHVVDYVPRPAPAASDAGSCGFLRPDLPGDSELAAMDDDAFDQDQWTDKAEKDVTAANTLSSNLFHTSLALLRLPMMHPRGMEPPASKQMSEMLLDPLLQAIVELLGFGGLRGFLAVCLRWFTVTVCHPLFIRTPFEICQQSTMSTLTDLMAQANEPPTSLQEDPAAAFEHAEVELQLTEFFASPPSSLSLVYLRYVRRLTLLFRWIHVSAECQLGDLPEARHGHVLSAIEEVRHRASDMASAGQQLLSQMPDAGLPSRWGEWLEHVLEARGLPGSHCQQFSCQRRRVSTIWGNILQMLEATVRQLEDIASLAGQLEKFVQDAEVQARPHLVLAGLPGSHSALCRPSLDLSALCWRIETA